MFNKSIQAGAILLASAGLLVACSKPEPAQEPVRAVRVMTVGLNPLGANTEFAGEVRARVESRLGFRVGGKVVRRQAEPGQRVKPGQVLAQLDPQDLKLAAEAGRAQVMAALTNRDLAAADFKRFKALRDQNFISSAELERRETTLKAAQAQLEQAQAQLASQGNQAAYTTLVADVSGVVTSVDVEAGQVITAGAPVVRIAQEGPRDAVFSVPEDRVGLLKLGATVDVRAWTSSTALKGVVREIAAIADPVTRTFQVKLALPATDNLALGSTVTVIPQVPEGASMQVIKLPTSALRQDGSATAVWVLDAATLTVKLQQIQIVTADGNEVVVSSGLQPGMQVVSAGVHVLSPGQKVSIYKEKQTLAVINKGFGATEKVSNGAPAAVAPASASTAK